MSIDVHQLFPRHSRRRMWTPIGVVVAGAATTILLMLALSGSAAGAGVDLGPGAQTLSADTTLADVVADLTDSADPFGVSGMFGAGFANHDYGALTLLADGSAWVVSAANRTFTLSATGEFVNDATSVRFDVLVHADASGASPTLVVAIQATVPGGVVSVADVLKQLNGTRAGDLAGNVIGLVTYQGTEPVPSSSLPSDDARAFLSTALAVDSLDSEITVEADPAGAVFLHAKVDPQDVMIASLKTIGAEQFADGDVHGVVTSSFSDLAAQRDDSANTFQSLYHLDLAMTIPASVPSWVEPGFVALADGSSDWSVAINYNQNEDRVQVSATGPSWELRVPVVFPEQADGDPGATFEPEFLLTDQVGQLDKKSQTLVGGAIGDWSPPDNPNLVFSLSAKLSKQGSEYFFDLYAEADLGGGKTAAGDVYVTKGSGGWTVTVSLDFPDMALSDLAGVLPAGALPEGEVPDDFIDVSLEDLSVIVDVSKDGATFGATGRLMVSPFDKPVSGGISLMFFTELSSDPQVMIGVAPSFRVVGGDDPASEPVYLSDLLDDAIDPAFDFKVYDPDEPTTGFGVVYSSVNTRIGGDACLVQVGEGEDCPPAYERTDVPTNVSQWLMPLWGFNGSDEALDDSTLPSGQCLICSFGKDFQPAVPFTVNGGLNVAASVIMPSPLGSNYDELHQCNVDVTSDACKQALGVLGSLGLDSRVQIRGSMPLGNLTDIDFGLTLKLGLLDGSFVDRPTWLNDAELQLDMRAGANGVTLKLVGKLQLAIKQGLSAKQAADAFGARSANAARNTLQPATAATVCKRNGVKLVERSGDGGFTEGATYCHDLLELRVEVGLIANQQGVSFIATGSLDSVKTSTPGAVPTIGNTVPNDAGWSPVGLDKFALNEVIVDLRVTSGPAGVSVSIGAAVSGQILTTPRITFSGALSLLIKPEGVALQGFRINIGQLTLKNIIEIYEWISGETVNVDDLPGVALRNIALSIGVAGDLRPICVEQGFFLSGDLYVSDSVDQYEPPAFDCISDSTANDYGKLSPAPAQPCDDDDIKAGCVAGIRLVVNDRGVFGDAFIAGFDAGPVHLFDPDGEGGRGVSVTFEITKLKVSIDMYGAAALGGTKSANGCGLPKYCDAWASGDFNAQVRAGINGAEIKLFGRVRSGIPYLSFQLLAAGRADIDGASALVGLFKNGTIPDASFALHVELANKEAAPDLDFAGEVQKEVDAQFGKVLTALNDAAKITQLLRTNPAAAADLLEKYEGKDPALDGLIKVVRDVLAGAGDADLQASLDWFVNGFYAGLPGIPNLGDVIDGSSQPRCDGLNWGYGPRGTERFQDGLNYYPYNFCFLHQPVKIEGACYYISERPCDLTTVAKKLIIEPILDIVLTGIDVSTDVVEFAQQATDVILSGELLRVDCASLDVSASVGGSLSSANFKGALQLGLFVTVLGQPIGTSFGWQIDTSDPDNFAKNVKNLFDSLMKTFTGTTESTCWSPEQIAEFFGTPIDDGGESGGEAPPPPPAVMTSAVVSGPGLGANLTRENDLATLTVTFDRQVAAARQLSVNWGDGSTVQTVAVAAGVTQVTATHTYLDDAPTTQPVDIRSATVTDTSDQKKITVPVSVLNVSPSSVTVSAWPASITENQSATLTVTFTDPGTLDTHVVKVDWGDGTSSVHPVAAGARSIALPAHTYLQNPLSEVAAVKVQVADKDGGVGLGGVDLPVLNVAPAVTEVKALGTVVESVSSDYRISWTDPGTLDGHVIWIDWNYVPAPLQYDADGLPLAPPFDEAWVVRGGKLFTLGGTEVVPSSVGITLGTAPVRTMVLPHTYIDDEPTGTPSDAYTVSVRITDLPDGDSGTGTGVMTLNDVAPVVSQSRAAQTVQYSDGIGDVVITATDITGDLLTATTAFTRNGVADATALPGGLSLSNPTCVPDSPGRQRCQWTLSGNVGVAAGTYDVTVTITDDDTKSTSVTTRLVVDTEDATVGFAATNPLDVRVASPGGVSPTFTLRFAVEETEPDLAAFAAGPGNIDLARVGVTLVPVGPGGNQTGTCTRVVSGSGYSSVLTVTCAFTGLPVNTYYVQVLVDGGYYDGENEDVVTISDPSLGFTTGGGWFYWPGTADAARGYAGDKTTFGYTMKYTKKLTNVQGNLVVIRHLADGTSYRLKSNSITGLSIGKGTGFGWATFTGKATYREPTWLDAVGNYTFTVYVEDRGEPGSSDRFWIEVKDKSNKLVSPMSVGRKATDGAVTLGGGNVVVPH